MEPIDPGLIKFLIAVVSFFGTLMTGAFAFFGKMLHTNVKSKELENEERRIESTASIDGSKALMDFAKAMAAKNGNDITNGETKLLVKQTHEAVSRVAEATSKIAQATTESSRAMKTLEARDQERLELFKQFIDKASIARCPLYENERGSRE